MLVLVLGLCVFNLVSGSAGVTLPFDEVACGESRPRELDASTPGLFISEDWPENYPPNALCEWVIRQDEDQELELLFVNFTLEASSDCENDYVEVYEGEDDEGDLVGRYCGEDLPEAIMSSGSELFVRFASNDDIESTGFLARYGEPDNSVACTLNVSDIIYDDMGTIMTPNWPLDYRFFLRCEWVFEAEEGETWTLAFADFETENCCDCDFMQVFDGPDTDSPRFGAWFGQYTKVPLITTSSNYMTVTFRSDWSANFKGFLAAFQKNPASN